MPENIPAAKPHPNPLHADGDAGCLSHWYPRAPRYRVSGMAVPQPGDRARCGWVKQLPPMDVKGMPECVVCAELRASGVLP